MFRCNLALAVALVVCAGAAVGQSPSKQAESGSPLEAAWADLASTDDAKASRALLAFAAKPKESVAFFKERVKPAKADAELFKKLLEQLDDKKFAVRDAASKQLTQEVEYLGKLAKPILEANLKGDITPERKKRIEELLVLIPSETKEKAEPIKLKGRSVSVMSGNGEITIRIDGKVLDWDMVAKPVVVQGPNTQWLRAVRAVTVLESIGTPEAKAILKTVAEGDADYAPTKEAKAALERLGK